MKKSILTIILAAAAIMGCKKSSTPITFSAVTGRWDGTTGTNRVSLYYLINSDGTLKIFQHANPDPNSAVGEFNGSWKFNAATMVFKDTVVSGVNAYFDSLTVSSNFKSMTGATIDTTNGTIRSLPDTLMHTSK